VARAGADNLEARIAWLEATVARLEKRLAARDAEIARKDGFILFQDALTPPPSADPGQDGDHATGPEA